MAQVKRKNLESLWGITSYFNSAGYARRLRNYRSFRKHLAIPLVTVELSFNGRFELDNTDAEVLVQLQGGDVMWQKERLLNLAVSRVPDACDGIAWVDCDVIFDSDEWVEQTLEALETYSLVHLFQERHDLKYEVDAKQLSSWGAPPTSHSLIYKFNRNEAAPEDFFLSNAPLSRRTTAGLAWASRRDLLEQHGLYDAAILGSGDRLIVCAALGEFEYGTRALMMNAQRAEHYKQWARPYYAVAAGRVTNIPGRLFHLWHGAISDRQYESRHRHLEQFDFNPFNDIAIAPSGAWRWQSNKTPMHDYIKDYFESRHEDD